MASAQWQPFPNNMFQFSAGPPSTGTQSAHIESPLSLKRRNARITKTTSTGTSPHTIGRRKTTAVHGSAGQRMMFDHHGNASESNISLKNSRPMSWHPSSFADPNHSSAAIPRLAPEMLMAMPAETTFTTASVNGVITPLSFPYPDDLPPTEMFSTLDGYQEWTPQDPFQEHNGSGAYLPQGAMWPQQEMMMAPTQHDFQQVHMDTGLPYTNDPSHLYAHQTIPHFALTQPLGSRAPPTPDFLPIQNFTKETEPKPVVMVPPEPGAKDELVGMGLYDPPDESPYDPSLEEYFYLTRLDGAGIDPRPQGKGLKLEETFNPTEIEDEGEEDDDEEEEDEDGQYSEEEIQEPPKAEAVKQSRPPPAPVPTAAPNLSNQSFFFEKEDAPANTSYYGQVPQAGSGWSVPGNGPYGWI